MDKAEVIRSLRTKRIVPQNTFGHWFDRTFYSLIGGTLVVSSIYLIWSSVVKDDLQLSQLAVAIVFALFGVWPIYGSIYLDALTHIKGTIQSDNKDRLYAIVTKKFPDMFFHFDDKCLYGYRMWTPRKPGRKLTAIFDGNDIYINIRHTLRFGNMDSPFHVIQNQVDLKEIKSKLESAKSQ